MIELFTMFLRTRGEKMSERENESVGMKGGKVLRAEDAFE